MEEKELITSKQINFFTIKRNTSKRTVTITIGATIDGNTFSTGQAIKYYTKDLFISEYERILNMDLNILEYINRNYTIKDLKEKLENQKKETEKE